MKRLHHIVILTLTLLALNSCEYEFDVKSKAKPGLYAQCVADAAHDEISIKLLYAAPAQGNTNDIPKLDIENLVLKADGVELSVEDLDSGFFKSILPHGTKELSLKVEAAGLPAIESSTGMPGNIKLKSVEHQSDTIMSMPLDIFTVKLDRQPEEGEYIAISMVKNMYDTDNNFSSEFKSAMMGASTDTEIEIANANLKISWFVKDDVNKVLTLLDENGEGNQITVIPAASFKDASITMPVMNFDGFSSPWDEPEEKVEYTKILWYFRAWSVDANFYRYALANYKSKRDFMAMMGLAPANFAWSNIKGGFGFCGSIKESEFEVTIETPLPKVDSNKKGLE